MNKVLLSICVLLIAQTSFAGHHEKSEQATKTIIGYEILDKKIEKIEKNLKTKFKKGKKL